MLDCVEAVAQTTLNSSASFGRGTAQLGESVLGHEMGRLAEMAPISLVLSHRHRWHHVPRLYATASANWSSVWPIHAGCRISSEAAVLA